MQDFLVMNYFTSLYYFYLSYGSSISSTTVYLFLILFGVKKYG